MKTAPNPKDTQDFQFKQSAIRAIYENFNTIPIACNLTVADAKRGLLYIACDNKLTALKSEPEPPSNWRQDHTLQQIICRLSISCDYSYLGITFNSSTAHIYNASSVSKSFLELIQTIELSTFNKNVFAYDLKWNPALPGMFCTVASDHTVSTFQVKPEQKPSITAIGLERNQDVEANCVAWSPKGKQLVVGCKNGNIIQLKPELKFVRKIPGPAPPIGEIITILWISNYQFCAAFHDNEHRVNVLIIDAPKGDAKPTFTCYEDITYGIPDVDGNYLPRYYFDHVSEWNLIIAASSTSSEVAVLGSPDNGTNWEQWQLIDSGRAQLPFVGTNETYPVGISIDKSSVVTLPWGPEGNLLPNPVPSLHIFGTSGQIVSFYMVNLLPNCPSLCSPPSEPINFAAAPPPAPAVLAPGPPRNSMLPSELSFALNTAVTSTPRPKQPESIPERPKIVVPTANFSAEIPAKNPPVAGGSLFGQQSVLQQQPPVELKIPKVRPEQTEVQQLPKTEIRPVVKEVPAVQRPPSPTPSPPAPTSPAVDPLDEKINWDDSIFWRNFCEEIGHFEKELQGRLEQQVWEVGTEEEKQKLTADCNVMEEFKQELVEITSSLSNEVSYLKALLLQTFAWIEETKSRNSAHVSSDTPRDRHDRSKIVELQKKFGLTQSQLVQAMKALDLRWAEHENRERNRMKIPSLEFIYQNLKKHAEIIAKEKESVEQLSKKWKALARGNKVSSLNRSIAKLSISSSGPSGATGDNGIIEARCRTIANNTVNFGRTKQLKLREFLVSTEPRTIKAIHPTPVQDKLEATLATLASPNSALVVAKPKSKILSERLAITTPEAPKIGVSLANKPAISAAPVTAAPTISATPVQSKAPLQTPLASLNSIVAKLGGEPSTPISQVKAQPLAFSSPFSLNFGSKINEKPAVSENPPTIKTMPVQPVSAAPQLQPASTINFPKPMGLMFGSAEPKQETIASLLQPKENVQNPKPSMIFVKKDVAAPAQKISLTPVNPLEATLPNIGSMQPKIDAQAAGQQPSIANSAASLGLSSLAETLSAVSSNTQQNVFSFANNPPFSLGLTKIPSTSATSTATGATPTFFLPVKTGQPNVGAAGTESTNVQPAANSVLDFSKLTMSLSAAPNLAAKPQISATSPISITPINVTTSATTVPATTINFGKATSTAANSAQPPKVETISLPNGTTIEKVATTSAATATTSASTQLIFGLPATGGNIFGGSTAATFSAATTLTSSSNAPGLPTSTSAGEKSATATSLPSLFGSSMATGFSLQTSTAPPSTAASQMINFGKPPTASPGLTFGKPAAAPAASITPASLPSSTSITPISNPSPFGQPAAASPINTMKPATTGFFSSQPATSNTSPFGGTPSTPNQNIFGGNNTPASPPANTSIFGGAATTPASPFGTPNTSGSIFGGAQKPAAPMFGAAPAFGGSPIAPPAAPAFGSPPTFGSRPVFGTQPTIGFGPPKPEFGSTFGTTPTFGGMGFGSASPPMGNAPMDKVFGSTAGNSTFESLATETNALTFGSLAQKSPTAEKTADFSGGQVWNTWR